MLRKQNIFIADTEKVLAVWIEDQTSHNLPLSQSLIQSKALTLFSSFPLKIYTLSGPLRFETNKYFTCEGQHGKFILLVTPGV